MNKYPKPYSFDWWLALYDKANQNKWVATILIHEGDKSSIQEYTRYEELSKWIRYRMRLGQHNKSDL